MLYTPTLKIEAGNFKRLTCPEKRERTVSRTSTVAALLPHLTFPLGGGDKLITVQEKVKDSWDMEEITTQQLRLRSYGFQVGDLCDYVVSSGRVTRVALLGVENGCFYFWSLTDKTWACSSLLRCLHRKRLMARHQSVSVSPAHWSAPGDLFAGEFSRKLNTDEAAAMFKQGHLIWEASECKLPSWSFEELEKEIWGTK